MDQVREIPSMEALLEIAITEGWPITIQVPPGRYRLARVSTLDPASDRTDGDPTVPTEDDDE